MFEAIGFDPKTYTNEQLLDRQMELAYKKMQAARFGKVDAMNQLHVMIQMIERERYERMYNERIGTHIINSSSVVVESDPTLNEKHLNLEDEKKAAQTKQPPSRAYPRPVRTTTPVNRTDTE